MNEQELAQWLEQALADLRLRVQVKAQPLQSSPGDYALVIMINHPAHVALDHERLTAWFQKAIPSRYPQVKRLALYSRPIGQQQANWKTQVRLAPEAATGRGIPPTVQISAAIALSKTASCSPLTCLNPPAWCARRSWVFITSPLGKRKKCCPCCPPCSATPVLSRRQCCRWMRPCG